MSEPTQGEITADGMSDMIESIADIAASIHFINQQAVREYTPIVETILSSRSHDKCHIEHTLDGLLDFSGYIPALQLYRRLCRYYWDIDSAATAFYVEAYRETWDSEKTSKEAVVKQPKEVQPFASASSGAVLRTLSHKERQG